MANNNLLECIDKKLSQYCDSKKLIQSLENRRHLSWVSNFKLLDREGHTYFNYSYSNEEYEMDNDINISLIHYPNCNSDFAVMVDSICLLSQDYPIQYIELYLFDGTIESYYANFNRELTIEKKLTFERIKDIPKLYFIEILYILLTIF